MTPAYLCLFDSWIQRRLVSCAKKKQLLLFQFAHHLELWRLGSTVATGKMGESFFFFLNLIYLFISINGCVGSSFLCEGFLQLWQAGATLHRGAWASHHRSLSCCGAQAPDAQAQQLWLTGPLLRGMWDLPRPGLEPVSPALAGRLSTTAPPGKPRRKFFSNKKTGERSQKWQLKFCLWKNGSRFVCVRLSLWFPTH